MANSCDTVQSIRTGDGTTTLFSFTFTYDKQSEVNVSLWDTTIKYYVPIANDQWSFANATTVSFVTAPPIVLDEAGNPLANIKIWRQTDLTSLVASFYPGSAIRAQDLNSNFEQLQHAIQDGRCSIPDGVLTLLQDYWNKNVDTITSTVDWVSSDDKVATTAAIEAQLLPYAFPEAPVNNKEYARKNAAWSEVTGFPEAPTDGKQYGRQDSDWTVIDTTASVPEAPENGTIYGRRNAGWVEVPTGGGGGGGGQVNTIVAGDDITVDSNDVINPKVSVTPGSFLKTITAGNNITVNGSEVSVTPNSFIPYNLSTLTALP